MAELGFDKAKLANWADLANSLQSSATDYEPAGMVESIDVFCAIPLAAVARDMEDWKTNHLGKWADFSRTKPRLHEVDGAHYTMITPTHVYLFQKKLKAALAEKGDIEDLAARVNNYNTIVSRKRRHYCNWAPQT